MRLLRVILAGVFVLFLIGWGSETRAQTEMERERASLRGLPPFPVVVNIEGPPRIERERETDVRLVSRAVEQHLREAKLPVRGPVQRGRDAAPHYLYLHVNILDSRVGVHPFAIELAMYQQARISRDTSIELPVRTWHGSAVGYLSGDAVVGIREAALKLVDDLIQDYREANPR